MYELDPFLIELLLKIQSAQEGGKSYFYKRQESKDPQGEVEALKELERLGYINCGSFQKDYTGPGEFYNIGGPCTLKYQGQQLLRGLSAHLHVGDLQKLTHNLSSDYSQCLEHLNQASKQLLRIDDERARKDAVRDCLSAMESLLKKVTQTGSISAATMSLKEKVEYPEVLVKDGLSIWESIHRLYPDVRHGADKTSTMSKEEALYWVERISTSIRFIASATQNN